MCACALTYSNLFRMYHKFYRHEYYFKRHAAIMVKTLHNFCINCIRNAITDFIGAENVVIVVKDDNDGNALVV